MKTKVLTVLKILYKILPFIITAIGGGVAASTIAGCKCGSLVSFVSPAI